MTFFEVITAAVADMTQNGFDSEARLIEWMERIRQAAVASLTPLPVMEAELKRVLNAVYQRQVDRGAILVRHGDVARFTLERVKPKLRAELDRRILASAGLIKLNRTQAIERTLQRFQGWATSIPAGGSRVVEKVPVKTDIRKALAQLPFEERRCATDQGYKLIAAVSNIIATDGGAIAGVWHDHGLHDKSYNARPEHLKRTGTFYLIRNNWAQEKGLCKPGPAGYMDEIEAPGELVSCRCFYEYIYGIRRLPDAMLTQEGLRRKNERLAA